MMEYPLILGIVDLEGAVGRYARKSAASHAHLGSPNTMLAAQE
jgi:hypothetical protein